MKKIFILIVSLILSGRICFASDEKSGFELPEVTIHGKDVSEYELPGGYESFNFGDESVKGKVARSEAPESGKLSKGTSFKNIGLSAGRYGTFTSNVDWAGMERSIDYLLQFQYAGSDGYRDHSSEDLYLPSGSIGFPLNDKTRFSGEFAYFKKRMELPGPITQPTPNAVRDNESTDFRAGFSNEAFDGLHSELNIFGAIARTDEDPIQKSFDDQFLGASAVFEYDYFKAGLDFSTEKLQDFYSYHKFSASGGVEQFELCENVYLDLSAEIYYYEGMAIRLNPKIAATWYANNSLSIFFEAGRNASVRNWSESYLSENYVEGNLQELRPQRDLEIAAGFNYLWMENLSSSIRLFQNNYKDLLVWQDLDNNGLYTLLNQPEAAVRGVELNAQYRIRDLFTWTSSVIVQDPDGQDFLGDEIPYIPKYIIQSGVEWQTPFKVKLGSDMSYTGSQFIGFSGSSQIQDYILWNFNVSYPWKNAVFYSKILNVLDQRYDYFFGYPGPDTQYQFGVIFEF